MYTVEDNYTTTSDWEVGAGTQVAGGNAVVKNVNGKWDIMSHGIDAHVTQYSSNLVTSAAIYESINNAIGMALAAEY